MKHPVEMDFSYMVIGIHFHFLCNYLQNNQSSTDPPTYTHLPTLPHPPKIDSKTISSQTVEPLQLPRNTDIKKTFLDTGKMCLITDIHKHNSPHLVWPLYQEKVHLQESPLAFCTLCL
jgi:hypothetical protein